MANPDVLVVLLNPRGGDRLARDGAAHLQVPADNDLKMGPLGTPILLRNPGNCVVACAADFPCFSARAFMAGCCRTSKPVTGRPEVMLPSFSHGLSPDPREEYACERGRLQVKA